MKALLTLFLLLAPLAAQDEPDPKAAELSPAEEANLLLSRALRRYSNREEIVARVDVRHEEKPLPQPGGLPPGAGGGVVMVQGGLAGREPFAGAVEAWRGADGAVVLVSERQLPGFALCLADGDVIQEVTTREGTIGLAQVKAELGALLDPDRFTRALLRARLTPQRDAAAGGDVTFKGEVSRDVVRRIGEGEMEGLMAKRALRAEAECVVTPQGDLVRATITIHHQDPLHEMAAKGLRKVRIGAGGGIQVGEEEDDEADDGQHDVETGSTTYALEFGRGGPSERARAFREKARRLAGEKK